jgi:formylglycine-generating enzyme required for sulfatase activity
VEDHDECCSAGGHDVGARGSSVMGSQNYYPEERPVRRVEVDGFSIDDHPVTVAEFRRFVTKRRQQSVPG